MITRIVKLTVNAGDLENFKKIFNDSQNLIKAFDGCKSLELKEDFNDKCTLFTISIWENEVYLESYRASYLFKNTWSKVKPFFSKKAEAWSLI